MPSIITGTGIAMPPNVVTNAHLARAMDTDDEWIRSRTGVEQRRFVNPGTGASDLAVEAGRMALADAGLAPGEVDTLITATMTPDLQNPGIAGMVQHGLGLGTVPVYDLRQQCSGFLYGLDLADALIATGRAETVLVAGAEVHAGYLPFSGHWQQLIADPEWSPTAEERERNNRCRTWAVIFGDGAGAALVRKGGRPGEGILASKLFTDGEHVDLVTVPGLAFRHQPYAEAAQIAEELHLPRMNGSGLYRLAVKRMPEAVAAVAEAAGVTVSDIELVVAHQANDRILDGVRKEMGVDATVVPSNIARWGNTTAGTLPILFHELRAEGRVKPGMLVCFAAFGAGAHWGAVLYRVPEA
jgi:3-oxoacyl-[acyl-carrier-protein] synthase-3